MLRTLTVPIRRQLVRAIILGVFFAVATIAQAREHFISPNRRVEAYTTANAQDGTGMKLFLRRNKTRHTGDLIFQNMRWIDAKWSPDSRFLAVVDHNDGHIADVYVFAVSADRGAQPQITLCYRTPNPGTYDVQWDVVRWDLRARSIILTKRVRDPSAHKITRDSVVARIGDTPLPFSVNEI